MALTPQELEAVRKATIAAKNGDQNSIRFFESIAAQGTARSKEFLDAKENIEMEMGGGLDIDMTYVNTLGLGVQQMKDCKEQTFKFIKGERGAIAFFNGCEAGANHGTQASAAMLSMRDHIRERVAEGRVIVPGTGKPAPVAVPTAIPPMPTAANPLPPPVATPAPHAVAHTQLRATIQGAQRPVTEPALKISSAVVQSVPKLDDKGVAMIREAIASMQLFSPEAVSQILDQYDALAAHLISLYEAADGAADTAPPDTPSTTTSTSP